MESGANVGAAGTQSIPDANGHIGHHKHGVPHSLNGHIDATGDNSKARGRHAGGLSNPAAQGDDARHKGDDPHHYPGDGAGQQGRIEAVLCRRSGKGCPGAHHLCRRFHASRERHSAIDGLSDERHSVVGHKCSHKAPGNRLNHRPVINHGGADVDEHIKDAGGKGRDGGQGVQGSVHHRAELLTVGQLVELVENGVQCLERPVLHVGPDLRPGHGHTLKLGVGFICHREKGVFDHLGGDLALLGILLDGALCNAHVLLNGSGDAGRIFKDGV